MIPNPTGADLVTQPNPTEAMQTQAAEWWKWHFAGQIMAALIIAHPEVAPGKHASMASGSAACLVDHLKASSPPWGSL